MIEVVPHQPRLHPVVDDPAIPTDLVHDSFVAPSGIVIHIDVAIVQVRNLLGGLLPRLMNYKANDKGNTVVPVRVMFLVT